MTTNLVIHVITVQNPKRHDTAQLRIHQNGAVSVKMYNNTSTQEFQKHETNSLKEFLTEYFYPRERIRIIALLTKERRKHPAIADLLSTLGGND